MNDRQSGDEPVGTTKSPGELDVCGEYTPTVLYGATTNDDFFTRNPLDIAWGSCIRENWISLYPQFKGYERNVAHVGGVPCVRISRIKQISDYDVFDRSHTLRDIIGAFLSKNGLRACGSAFFADSTPIFNTLCMTVYVPVEPIGIRGRIALWRMRMRRAGDRSPSFRSAPFSD